ncbi:ubiquitin carboxyl-terminal hydrolase CYLD-like isoform X2 [Tubulanus polymorphus]|uniref:ubiquitin carboxyl-terminal hydrolase CYLD-like isoform X2 n=1 Tax=Tubulanus polymorphus TaxID=672921 RepID=UPI003DA2F0EB
MASDTQQRPRYILKKEHIANKKEKTGFLSRQKAGDEITVLPGTLWKDYEDKQTKKHEKIGFSYFASLDFDNLILSCPPNDVSKITFEQYLLLASISTCADRVKVFDDQQWLDEGLNLLVSDFVSILHYPNLPDRASGIIRYKGCLTGIRGLWFGVELLENKGRGTTDGTLSSQRYFMCEPDSGIFVNISKIRRFRGPGQNQHSHHHHHHTAVPSVPPPVYTPSPSTPQYSSISSTTSIATPPSATSPIMAMAMRSTGQHQLVENERVVWLSDRGPEYGTVRWIGYLPDVPDEVTVGVEFDNPVGSGTGKYKDQQLFKTKSDHASLVPIMGLMKEEEFLNPPTHVKMPLIDFERPRTRPKLKRDDKSSSSDSGTSGFNTYSSVHKPNDRRQKSEKTYHNDTNAMSPTLAVKMASKQTGKEETDVLRDQKRSLQQTRASSLDSHSKTSSAQSSSSSSSNSKGLPPTRSGHIKTEKKKAISFSNDGLPETNEPMLRSPLSPNATRPSVLKNSNSKNVHTVTADIEPVRPSYIDMNHDTCSDTLEHENGMCRLSGISQSPSNISNISGISNLSDLTDSSSPENTSPVYPPNSEHYKPKLLKDVPQIVEPSCSSSSSCSSESTDKKSNGNNTSTNRNRSEHSVAGSYVTNNGNSVYNGRSERSRKNSDSSAPKNTSLNSNTADLEIGSVVEVLENPPRYGVIRWIGCLPEAKDRNKLVAGLEMEEECAACLDGTFNGRRIFSCPSKKGFFVYLNKVRKDPRFQETKNLNGTGEPTFGSEESPDIPGNVSPPTVEKNLPNICGKNKGLQGHHNSCYLDATLFSMFAFTQVFDTILHRPKKATDLDEYEEIQKVLRESIVNPLRKFFYVRADKLLKLRTFLDKLSSVNGMMGEEKDPEEFLNSLLQQTLKADPLIKLSSGQESYFYQLFIEKDEKIVLPTTQQLLNLSFLQSDIKLAEIPSCLILQMPRFGKDYKMYQRIVPSLYLDITDILMNAPRECAVCGCLAECECKQCYNHFSGKTSFCGKCFNLTHSRHAERTKHISRPIIVPETYKDFLNQQKELLGDGNVQIDHEMMELFAVVCIETSHYVAFVKCGPGRKAPWVFFDSMADRMGQEHGYNIPEVQPCQELPEWLADDNHERILSLKEDRQLPSYARRVLCDAYLCMYQSTEVMMYK